MPEVKGQYKGRYNSSSFSVIGEDAVYRGDVEFEGVLHINGDFHGNIQGNGDLGVGLTGRVRSVIQANNVIISGLVCGNVFASGRVGIKSSAIVIGNIQATTLVAEEGSIFHGKLEILDRKELQKIAKPALLSYRKTKTPLDTVALAETENVGQAENPLTSDTTTSDKNTTTLGKNKYSVWN